MKTIQAALLLLLSIATLSFGDTAAENAFLKSLITPALGTTPEDWIASFGEPSRTDNPTVDEKHPTINDKDLILFFDRGDASSLITSDLDAQFDIAIDQPVRAGLNWTVNGRLKNNSNITGKRYSVRLWLYTVDDKHRLLGKLFGTFNDHFAVLEPGEERPIYWIFNDKENITKSIGTGLSFDPCVMMP